MIQLISHLSKWGEKQLMKLLENCSFHCWRQSLIEIRLAMVERLANTSSEMIASMPDVSVKGLVPSSSFSREACYQKASDLDKLIESTKKNWLLVIEKDS